MSVVRRFLVAPSLVRLIRKERGSARVSEGYFAPQAGRTSFVRVDGQQCHLVLVTKGEDGALGEERTDVPRAHGEALLDVCPGKASYERTSIAIGSREAVIDRYVSPGALDLVSVSFDTVDDAKGFSTPLWFGREITEDATYERQSVALQGPPQAGEVHLTNAALESVLDLIEPRFGFGRYGSSTRAPEPKPAEPEDPSANLRRMMGGAAPLAGAAGAATAVAAAQDSGATPDAAGSSEANPPAESASPEHDVAQSEAATSAAPGDARIDDVIESLSQALGAAIQHPQPPAPEPVAEDPASAFERWTVRPRRTNQT